MTYAVGAGTPAAHPPPPHPRERFARGLGDGSGPGAAHAASDLRLAAAWVRSRRDPGLSGRAPIPRARLGTTGRARRLGSLPGSGGDHFVSRLRTLPTPARRPGPDAVHPVHVGARLRRLNGPSDAISCPPLLRQTRPRSLRNALSTKPYPSCTCTRACLHKRIAATHALPRLLRWQVFVRCRRPCDHGPRPRRDPHHRFAPLGGLPSTARRVFRVLGPGRSRRERSTAY